MADESTLSPRKRSDELFIETLQDTFDVAVVYVIVLPPLLSVVRVLRNMVAVEFNLDDKAIINLLVSVLRYCVQNISLVWLKQRVCVVGLIQNHL